MKRVERKHIKEDELVSGLNKFVQFLKAREKELFILAGVLVVLAALYGGVLVLKSHNLKKQSQTVSEILSLGADLETKPENLAKLEKLAGNGKFARVAWIEIATYWMGKGDLAKAETNIIKVKAVPRDLVYYQSQDLLAQICLQRKEYDKAIEIYQRIEGDKPSSYPLDAVLFHRAEALELKGDKKGALDLYKKIQEEYAQTYYGYEASLKAGRLGKV